MTRTTNDNAGLAELLCAGESAQVEFKTTLSDTKRIVATIAAMATAGGGMILVGVRPDGDPVGAALGEGEIERLTQQILANTDPRLFVDIDRPQVSGKVLLRIRVPAGDGPHLAFGRAYYRSGPATVAMTRDEYERRLLDRMRESSGFERRVESAWADTEVDQDAMHRFGERLAREGRADPGPDEALLGRLHLGRPGALTVAAILLFGRSPQGPLPQAAVRARARRGAAEDSAPIEGTLFDQIDRACDFVARNLKVRAVRTGVVREDVPDLPLDAVREVIANAVAHRDYRSTAAVQLRLDDDGLVIWNPGHFPPPITPEALRREHPSVPTNPLLARALYLAGYIEEWGTGTLRVVEAMAKNDNPPPLFEERDGGVRVALPMTGALPADLLPREQAFLKRRRAARPFSTSDYARAARVSHRTALGDLGHLESLGLVRRTGQGRSTRWTVA